MNELHKEGHYDPFAIRKKYSPSLWERSAEIAEVCVIALLVCALVYHLVLS
jgi:hypothetical protein